MLQFSKARSAKHQSNVFKRLKIRSATLCAATVAIATLSACGGGGDDITPPPPAAGVVAGFSVSPSFIETRFPDFAENDGTPLGPAGGRTTGNVLGCPFDSVPNLSLPAPVAVGSGTTGNGGIGIGGAPGRFKGVEITVTYPDATEIGRGIVDDARGMITVFPGETYTGGLIVTVSGTPTGLYWDPATDTYQPFTTGDRWRAYVDGIRGNIAVSPLTEAAARVVDLQGGAKTAAKFKAANELVAREVNRCLPAAFRVRDITRLSETTLNENSVETSVTDEFAGRQIIAIAGLMKSFDPAVSSLTGSAGKLFASYLALDLLDNTIDGLSNGQPIPSSGSTTGSLPADTSFFSNVKWGIDQTWFKYRDPAYAPLLNSQSATYDCYEFVNGTSVGGVDGENNPITTRQATLTYFPVTNAVQFDGTFEFSAPFRSVKEGPDQFGRNQQKELIGGLDLVDNGVTTTWEAKRTVVYVPSFYKKKIVQADQSSTEIQCYGPEPEVIVDSEADESNIENPKDVASDEDINDGF